MLNYRLGTVVKLSEGSEKGGGNFHLFFLLAESRIVRFFFGGGEQVRVFYCFPILNLYFISAFLRNIDT